MVPRLKASALDDRTTSMTANPTVIATALAVAAAVNSNLAAEIVAEEDAPAEVEAVSSEDFLPDAQYMALSKAQKHALYEKRKAAESEETRRSDGPLPSSIAINQQDTQSVLTTLPAGTPAPAADPNSSFIRQMLSNSSASRSAAGTARSAVFIDGVTYHCDMHRM
jgi:hypothetical protein